MVWDKHARVTTEGDAPMTKTIRAVCTFMLLAIALTCAACAAVEQSALNEQSVSASEVDPATISEGVDTPCEVVFAAYGGSREIPFLSEGDSVAVISPSALPSQEQVENTVAGLESWGYVPVLGKHVCEDGRTLQDCVDDLVWALEDPNIKAIFCVRGGYGASEIMDKLTTDLVAASDKLIIGYSDITVFHSAWTSANLASVHACMSVTFDGLSMECAEAERRLIAGEVPTYTCAAIDLCKGGEAEGILVGGNLSTFTAVLGTAYDCTQTEEPYILFLEDVGEDVRHIHRCLTILKHLGVLEKAAGIVFGEWVDLPADGSDLGGSSRGGKFTSVADMISREILFDVDVPVAFGLPAGHGNTNYPLLMGVTAHLNVGEDSFTLGWPAK